MYTYTHTHNHNIIGAAAPRQRGLEVDVLAEDRDPPARGRGPINIYNTIYLYYNIV